MPGSGAGGTGEEMNPASGFLWTQMEDPVRADAGGFGTESEEKGG